MTLHIQMLYEVAKNAKSMADAAQAMADAMQAIVDDCAEQLAVRKAAGETDEAMLNEVFGGKANAAGGASKQTVPAGMMPPAGVTPYDGPTPFDEKADNSADSSASATPPAPTVASAAPVPTVSTAPSSTPEKPKLTIVELRAYVAERSTPENRPKIKAILAKFGVKKLTELSEDKYEAVKSEVAAL